METADCARSLGGGPCMFPAVTFRFLFGKVGHAGGGAGS